MSQANRRQFLKYTGGVTTAGGVSSLSRNAQAQVQSPVVWDEAIGGELRKYLIGTNTIVFGNSDGWIRTLDIQTGEPGWRENLDSAIYPGGLTQTERYVVAITEDGAAHFISKSTDSDRDSIVLSGEFIGVDSRNGKVCIGTKQSVRIFDLPPKGETLKSWDYTEPPRAKESDSGTYGPPVVWTNNGILVSGSEDKSNVVNVLSTQDLDPVREPSNENGALGAYRPYDYYSVAHSGDYVAINGFTGSNYGGRSVSDSVVSVVDTSVGRALHRNYTQNAMAVGVTDQFVVYDYNEQTKTPGVTVRSHGTYEEKLQRKGINPYPKGICTDSERIFIAEKSQGGSATRIRSLDYTDYPDFSFGKLDVQVPFKLQRLKENNELLFGFDKSNGRLVALSKTADETPTPEPPETHTYTPSSEPSETPPPPPNGPDSPLLPVLYLFDIVLGLGVGGLIVGDYMLPDQDIADTERNSLFLGFIGVILTFVGLLLFVDFTVSLVINLALIFALSLIVGYVIRLGLR